MRTTLREVARMAGVSTTTVSRVLNNKAEGNMREETLARIKRIIELTGYSPNPVASSLRSGWSRVIGVILPDATNPYYSQLATFVEDEAYNNDHLIFVCNSNMDVARERRYIEILSRYRVSGILLCSTGLASSELNTLLRDRTRYVLLDEEITDYHGDLVVGDDFKGGYLGAEYLYGLGHRRMVIILGPSNLSSTHHRLEGVNSFCASAGDVHTSVVQGDFTVQSGYAAVTEKAGDEPYTAVFSFNDLMAIGAIHALQSSGRIVPDQVSVLGYDDIFLGPYISPAITTVATPLDQLAKAAVEMVAGAPGREKEDAAARERIIPPRLIIRESCSEPQRQ